MTDNLVFVGAIVGAFGVKGEIRLRSFTANPEDIFNYAPFYDAKGALLFEVKSWRAIKDDLAFYPKVAITREQAMALKSTKLYVPREKLPAIEEDEYYHIDLIGLKLESLTGEYMGKINHIISGAQELLEITDTPNTKNWYLPFTLANVPVVDIKGGKIIVDVPDGLLTIHADKNKKTEE